MALWAVWTLGLYRALVNRPQAGGYRVRKGKQSRELQQLRDLHRVQGRSFEQLIAANPKRQPVFERAIDPDAAHFTIVLSGDVQRHRITIVLRFVNQLESGRLRQNLARLFD